MKINRIDIVSVPVTDQDAAKNFYQKMLGFKVVQDNPMPPDRRWIQLTPPHGETSITLVTWFDDMPAGSFQGGVLDTDGIESTVTMLTDRGLEVTSIEEAPWGRYCTFTDPDGNGWVLQESPEN